VELVRNPAKKKHYNYRVNFPYLFFNRVPRTFILRHMVDGERFNNHFTLPEGRFCLKIIPDSRLKNKHRIEITEIKTLDDIEYWSSVDLFEKMY